jgi:hypothetical protein
MSDWLALLQKPSDLDDGPRAEEWFGRLAGGLLNHARVLIGGEPHRFTEIEMYYHGDPHLDPFTHRDPIQLECGRWYFHRSRGQYRSGSFKGVDLTFGDGSAFAGVLIRGIETADGTLIDGPSLTVDYLLTKTGTGDVAALDRAIAGRQAWDAANPLLLEAASRPTQHEVFRSARVGLSLKRAGGHSPMPRYVLRAYRYLTEPRRISKGKPLLVLALYASGADAAAIQQRTGCPAKTVQRYLADFEAGRREKDFTPYFKIDLSPADLCRLHGTWHELMRRS